MKYAWVHNESQSKNGWTPLRLLSNRNMSIHTKSRVQFAELILKQNMVDAGSTFHLVNDIRNVEPA
ncbi:hypothetical protein OUZ56_000771 [Daphnia magna]|uniref:Uncharacterized protein n=1 Tax=Daphnia magna TaxID=35525 RepID=A0ABR0A0N9_9CRUS|nr:hypothetical protein OUZ56_000771 [Daphnia magna]